jgi:hypothetical protein
MKKCSARNVPGSNYVGANLKSKFLNGFARNRHHSVPLARDHHFDGSEPRLLLQPFGAQVKIEIAVQKLADATYVEESAAGAVAHAFQRQVHVSLSEADNDGFRLDLNGSCGLRLKAKSDDSFGQSSRACETRSSVTSGILRLYISRRSIDE